MRKIEYEETAEFARDLKKLSRRFSSLADDLEISKQYRIELFHFENIDSGGICEIEGIGNADDLKFYKVRKFQCKSLKGRGAMSGIRVIYAYVPSIRKVIFIEIYFKADKESENRQRVKDYLSHSMTA